MLVEVDNAMRVAQEEIFGPVMAIIAYETEEEAIAIANDSVYGLSGSVWTSDARHGLDIVREMRTGMVSINGAPQAWGTPFGGFKQSGIGREMGPEGLQLYVEVKSIAVGSASLPVPGARSGAGYGGASQSAGRGERVRVPTPGLSHLSGLLGRDHQNYLLMFSTRAA